MREAPSLVSLATEAIKTQLVRGGDDFLPEIYELPSDLFDLLVSKLPPLALEKLQTEIPYEDWMEYESNGHHSKTGRKRGRKGNFNAAWKALFKFRWPELADGIEPLEWQQIYWQRHLQNCLDEAAESAFIPSFDGHIGDTKISDDILKFLGCEGSMIDSMYSKLSYHCLKFAHYARCIKLQNVLCVGETCELLQTTKLQSFVLRWIRSVEHVGGVCKLLMQNSGTLTSLELMHCMLSSTFINAICGSLKSKGQQECQLKEFSINSSSFFEVNQSSLQHDLVSFLSSGRSLFRLRLHDNYLNRNFAQLLFASLLDASSNLSILDLSDNNIAGWLANFNSRSAVSLQSSLGTGKSLKSLHVLNIRGNNLQKDDVDSLMHAWVYMPNLKILDLSDNPIEDQGVRSLLPCLHFHLAELRLENCELSCEGVTGLLDTLSTFKCPLRSLSLADNELGSCVGRALGKFLGSPIEVLNIGGIGLGSSGFVELQKEMAAELNLIEINVSKNRGGLETAKFLSKLLLLAPALVAANATYNLMPVESLGLICTALKGSKGKLERLDLTGNTWEIQPAHASMLAEFQFNGKPMLILPSLPAPDVPYDDDP